MSIAIRRITSGIATVCISVLSTAAWGQSGAQGEQMSPPEGFGPTSATIEAIMDTAVRNIGRRYNLNDMQMQYTEELMKTEVRRFLIEHEDAVWPAIRDILSSGMGTKLPEDSDEVKRMGKMIRPLAKLAADAIFRSNDEWRKHLTDEQKRMHDFDMEQMRMTFDYIDENLEGWERGEPDPDRGFFPKAPTQAGPPIPSRPRTRPGRNEVPIIEPPISVFDTFVEEFIADYELSEGQVTSARSILVEFKGKAQLFKKNNKENFQKFAMDRSRAEAERDLKEIKRITAEHKEALRPFYSLFSQMEERLRALLTSTQIAKYEERNKPQELLDDDADAGRKDAQPVKKQERENAETGGSKEG